MAQGLDAQNVCFHDVKLTVATLKTCAVASAARLSQSVART